MAALYATFCTGFCILLAAGWCAAVACPWYWIRADNAIIGFTISIFSVSIRQGLGTSVLSGLSKAMFGENDMFSKLMAEWMNRDISISDAKVNFCLIDIFQWCDQWEQLYWGSWIMAILGFVCAAMLITGGCFCWFYANVYPTEIGRKMAVTFLSLAPLVGIAGVGTYLAMTLNFGKSNIPVLQMGSHGTYGPGFIVGCALCPFTLIPIYIVWGFSRVDKNEEKIDEDEEEAFKENNNMGAYPQAGYGSFQNQQPGHGYVAAPPITVVTVQGPPVVMGNAGGAQNSQTQSQPGMGAPAW